MAVLIASRKLYNVGLEELVSHYGALARKNVHAMIRAEREVDFDKIYALAMSFPTVQISSLRAWILEISDVTNLRAREKVAKPGVGHRIKLRDGKDQTADLFE